MCCESGRRVPEPRRSGGSCGIQRSLFGMRPPTATSRISAIRKTPSSAWERGPDSPKPALRATRRDGSGVSSTSAWPPARSVGSKVRNVSSAPEQRTAMRSCGTAPASMTPGKLALTLTTALASVSWLLAGGLAALRDRRVVARVELRPSPQAETSRRWCVRCSACGSSLVVRLASALGATSAFSPSSSLPQPPRTSSCAGAGRLRQTWT